MNKYRLVSFATALMLLLSSCALGGKPDTRAEKDAPEAAASHEYREHCTVPQTEATETEAFEYFSEEITFTCEYISGEDHMPYALITPSSADSGQPLPLIVWLHGMSERDANETWFMNIGLPRTLRDWEMEGFHAYVICPQLSGRWNGGSWCQPGSVDAVKSIIDAFVADHPVDMDNIIIGGFSLGGRGAMYTALELPGYFSRLVVFSSLDIEDRDLTEIEIPTLGCSEYAISYNAFMKVKFLEIFGEGSVWYYDSTHNDLIDTVFRDDRDRNGRSDVVEWMLGQLDSRTVS